jgi:hypothetical protein
MTTESKVEKKHIRGRNLHTVIQEIVNEYNSSNGWALVRVTPTLLNIEVHLERSVNQGTGESELVETKTVAVDTGDSNETKPKEDVPVTPKTTTAKKPTKAEQAKLDKAEAAK